MCLYKYCTACNQRKPVEEFKKNPKSKDGYSTTCKECLQKLYNEKRVRLEQDGVTKCKRCGDVKPRSEFVGIQMVCKECVHKARVIGGATGISTKRRGRKPRKMVLHTIIKEG